MSPLLAVVATLLPILLGAAQSDEPAGAAPIQYERPESYVDDKAEIIDDEHLPRIEAFLAELESETGAIMNVLTVTTTGTDRIDAFARRHFRAWYPTDRGLRALLVISITDKKWFLEVGQKFDRQLTLADRNQIDRDILAPAFRNEAFGAGILEGARFIAKRLQSNDRRRGFHADTDDESGRTMGSVIKCGAGLFALLMVVIVFSALFRRGHVASSSFGGTSGCLGALPWIFLGLFLGGGRGLGRGGHYWGGGRSWGGFGGGGRSFGGSRSSGFGGSWGGGSGSSGFGGSW